MIAQATVAMEMYPKAARLSNIASRQNIVLLFISKLTCDRAGNAGVVPRGLRRYLF